MYLFTPQNTELLAEYELGWKTTDLMPVNVLGFQSHRDHFAIAFDEQTLRKRMNDLRDPANTDADLRERFKLKDNRDWQLTRARRRLQAEKSWEQHLISCSYRPFDWRPSYFTTIAMDYPRRELLDHVAGKENLCLNTVRQTKANSWQHAVVSEAPAPAVFVEVKDGSNIFPLYQYPTGNLFDADQENRRPNLASEFIRELSETLDLRFVSDGQGDLKETFGPEDIFHYAYAVFHSPTYRERYAEFLKRDFPRLPLTSDLSLFSELCQWGEELVSLHLMRSPLLDDPFTTFPENGSNVMEKLKYDSEENRVYINKEGQYFDKVPEETWNFQVGGYQVLQKWLKDRKGRTLSEEDIEHYKKVVKALHETSQIMKEIDEVIEAHGGWPLPGSVRVEEEG